MPRHRELPGSLTPAAFQILLALADEARHGLGIVDEVESRTEGAVKLGPGSLYGTIKKLREVKFIQEADESLRPSGHDPRRRYWLGSRNGRIRLQSSRCTASGPTPSGDIPTFSITFVVVATGTTSIKGTTARPATAAVSWQGSLTLLSACPEEAETGTRPAVGQQPK